MHLVVGARNLFRRVESWLLQSSRSNYDYEHDDDADYDAAATKTTMAATTTTIDEIPFSSAL